MDSCFSSTGDTRDFKLQLTCMLIAFCHCDKVPEKINLKEERFILTQFRRLQSMVTWICCFLHCGESESWWWGTHGRVELLPLERERNTEREKHTYTPHTHTHTHTQTRRQRQRETRWKIHPLKSQPHDILPPARPSSSQLMKLELIDGLIYWWV
jgi:hypothetical protein